MKQRIDTKTITVNELNNSFGEIIPHKKSCNLFKREEKR